MSLQVSAVPAQTRIQILIKTSLVLAYGETTSSLMLMTPMETNDNLEQVQRLKEEVGKLANGIQRINLHKSWSY
ncbi:hypothetical protein CFP56_034388 [Quercus suber]|uniref:Uncharacterized protein n=1 Tax=Quercus suber TaxID=58331 RepID=A0AAW0JCT2_QUESU